MGFFDAFFTPRWCWIIQFQKKWGKEIKIDEITMCTQHFSLTNGTPVLFFLWFVVFFFSSLFKLHIHFMWAFYQERRITHTAHWSVNIKRQYGNHKKQNVHLFVGEDTLWIVMLFRSHFMHFMVNAGFFCSFSLFLSLFVSPWVGWPL